MPFVHLHVHSEYSLLDSTCRIGELAAFVKNSGQTALALTDRNVMYGAIPFYRACRQAGVHPVIGMELAIDGEETGTDQRGREEDMPVIVLLAQNDDGYRNLVRVSSLVQFSERTCLTIDRLEKNTAGLIALSGGPEGPIDRLFALGEDSRAIRMARRLHSIFGSRFFLEIQRDQRMNERSESEQKLIALGRSQSIRLVAASSIRYLRREDEKAYVCLSCIKKGAQFPGTVTGRRDFSFKSTKDMAATFTDLPDALAAAGEIAGMCHVSFAFGPARLPHFPLPEGESSGQRLRAQCRSGLAERYATVTEPIRKRLDYELSVIEKMGFNDYFLIVADLVAHARSAGYTPGPGRGSAAGSLVAFALKITEVDPIKYHLLFERFLNPERVTMPDIDLDFPDVDRDKMIAYAYKKYGRNHVAQIITFGTLAARAAIRDVGRVLGSDPRLVDRIARLIPSVPKMTLEQALQQSANLRTQVHASAEAEHLFTLARRIEGLPRHASIHAAGVVLSDRPLTDSVPLQKGHDTIPVTQYTMDILESLGLLKIDFLALRNLTFMREVMNRTAAFKDGRRSIASIPLADPKTYQLLSRGETGGIFQLESDGMRQVLRKLRPTEFEDIVAVSALYRPGPVQFIDRYVRRKHGEETVEYPHPDLEPILKSTYGVLVYQEQIMQIAVQMAGYSLGQADILRRAVGKKNRQLLENQKKTFIAGCLRHHYSEKSAAQIFDLIVRFANYGFNRSHAVAYSLVSYRLAYLKAHFPQAFMAAHLTSVIGHPGKLEAAVRELQSLGIPLLPPSINESMAAFEPSGNGIRFGLAGIKNVGGGAAEALVAERIRNGAYKNLYDFCRRVPSRRVNRKSIETLIFAGAFDCFGVDRAVLIASLERALLLGSEEGRRTDGQQFSFLTEEEGDTDYMDVPPLSAQEKMHYEREALGFYLSAHPINDYRDRLPESAVKVSDVSGFSDGKTLTLAVMAGRIKRIKTRSGQPMAFFLSSDETGAIETVCFPDTYEKAEDLLQNGRLLMIQARRSSVKESGAPQLVLVQASALDAYLSKRRTALFLKIDREHHRADILAQLKSMIADASGDHRVFIYYEPAKKTVALDADYSVRPDAAFMDRLRTLLGEKNVVIRSVPATE